MNILHNTRDFLKKHKALIILSFFLSALLFALPACNENGGDLITPAGNDNVSVGFYAENESGDNTLEITEAKFLLRKLTLKREGGENECDVKLGPFIVYLDLTGKVVLGAITKIEPATYDAVKFQVHKPNPNEVLTDPDFTESNSRRYSVVVKGLYNGVPFVYKSDVTVAKKIDFENHAIQVSEAAVVHLTVRLNPFSWFMKNGQLLDPLNGGNSHEIDHNIKESLKRAFRDMDKDGNPD
jgi:hypothetical protein